MFNRLLILLVLGASVAIHATAQTIVSEEALDSYTKTEKPREDYSKFSEKIDPHSGNLTHSYVDVNIPGPAGLDITVTRSYDVAGIQSFNSALGVTPGKWPLTDIQVLGTGWKIQVAPIVRIEYFGLGGTEAYLRPNELCLNMPASQWSLYSLQLPGGTTQPLHLKTTGSSVETSNGWVLTCTANVHTLRDPNGIKYTLGQVLESPPISPTQGSGYINHQMVLQATRVEDVHGNYYQISYHRSEYVAHGVISPPSKFKGDEPLKITSSDGRIVDFVYNDNYTSTVSGFTLTKTVLQSITFPGGQISYQVSSAGGDHPEVRDGVLSLVTLPDNTTWSYQYYPWVTDDPSRPVVRFSGVWAFSLWSNQHYFLRQPALDEFGFTTVEGRSGRMKRVTMPTGGHHEYEYAASELISSWRSPSGSSCRAQRYELGDALPPPSIDRLYHQFLRISKKSASDGGIWQYSYTLGGRGQYDKTEVSTPTGLVRYEHIGSGYFVPAKWASLPLHEQLDASAQCDPNGSFTLSNFEAGSWKLGLLVSEHHLSAGYSIINNWTGRKRADLNTNSFVSARVPLIGAAGDAPNGYMAIPYYHADLTTKYVLSDVLFHINTFGNYDAYGNPGTKTEVGDSPNKATTLTYWSNPAKGIVGKLKDEVFAGGSTLREFDANGNLTSLNVDNVVTTFTYDVNGNMASKTEPRGLTTTYENYHRGVAQSEYRPEGVAINRVVDDAGNVALETDGEGHLTLYTYDGLRRTTSVTKPSGNVEYRAYTSNSETITRGPSTEVIQYDGLGRVESITVNGVVTNYEYDAAGRKTFESNPSSLVGTTIEYDQIDRPIKVTHADGEIRTATYGMGAKTDVTDERGNITTYRYRTYGDPKVKHLMSVTTPIAAANITITRNNRDLITSVTQGGLTRTYGYNSNYYLTQVVNPETGTTTIGRDAAGNMTSKSVGASGTTNFTYDHLNRLTSMSYPGSTPSVSFTYDKNDKIRTANSSIANRSYGYDHNGNLISETLTIDGNTLAASYTYNGNDHLSSLTYPLSGLVINYLPDADGRPTQVSGFVNNVEYWPSGLLKEIEYANGTTSSYDQDIRLWPSSFKTEKAGTSIYMDSSYTYDEKGNLIGVNDTADSSFDRVIGYDALDRVTSASGTWGPLAITYSGVGNILSQTLSAGVMDYSYDASNKLTTLTGLITSSVSYDAYGNITSSNGSTYQYDDVPSLRCVNCSSPSLKIEYSYDARNQRVSKLKGGIKSYEMINAKGNQLIDFIPGGQRTEFIYLGNKRIAQRVTP